MASSTTVMTTDERPAQAVRQELDRVLGSPGFARNARMSQFLRFLVERHLEGRDDELKESLIAVGVFGRRPDYDPKLDSIVRTEATRLRARLTEYYAREGASSPVIIDVPKGGYIPVFRAAAPAPPGPPAPRRYRLVAGLAAPLLVVTAVTWWGLSHEKAPTPIAVLPLENLSPEPGNDYFVDGLTDEIIRNLSVIEGLAVRSRMSSFVFKGQPRNVREAGRQLDADYLIEGSVLRVGEQLRINVQLIRVRDDYLLWSERFDRRLTDVFAIQDEISLGVVNNLRLQLGRGRRRYETSVAAYQLYLRARARSLEGIHGTIQSISLFEQVINADAAFAPAWAGLASAYAIRSTQFPLEHPAAELTDMRSAAEQAVSLDPLLPEAHAALALVNAREGLWEAAEQRFRRAIDLDPNRSRTFTDFALWHLSVLGRNEEAVRQLWLAEASDPLSPEVQFSLAWLLMALGRYDEAATHCARLPASDALKGQCLGRALTGQGRVEEAVQLLSEDPGLARNPQTRGFLGYALARAGHRQQAEQMAAASSYANEQALIYAGLGDKDRTFDALERMTAVGAQRLGRYLSYPELALLRADPRLNRLREQAGLPR
jgi:adenylate cyclase